MVSDCIELHQDFKSIPGLIILEGLLVNSFVQAQYMPNYPELSDSAHFSNVFQRTYSFGGNATVTSVLMVVMFSLIPFSLVNITTMFVVILTVASGVASLTEAATISPRPACRPVAPPRGFITAIFRAPELSATSSIDCI